VEAIDLVGLFTEQRGWWRQSLETCHAGPPHLPAGSGRTLEGFQGALGPTKGVQGLGCSLGS
jgi:hypothetical protein